ncbi:hypothetical protein [Paraburkholderia sp. JPY465]|uniref:hypothetical protein n=1 Tax=Paraburkholderia sp. JPY465 TaxID=3042285 RepID=UPI003D1F40FB
MPGSIGIKEVLSRLSELKPNVTQEITNFCTAHFNKRNAELHSGELAFIGYGSSTWLPRFYQASEVFLGHAGEKIEDFYKDPEHVRRLIDSLTDQAADSVRSDIAAYQKVWSAKSADERENLINQASAWATRHNGHRVACPACGSTALLTGTATGPVNTKVTGDEIEQTQAHIPSHFECIACGLRISGFSKLAACNLANAFTATSTFSASEFFGLHTDDDLESAVSEAEESVRRELYEPDFNE